MGGVQRVIFITGTDTGVGKTVLTSLLIERLLEKQVPAAALKPFCSGGREDAEVLHSIQNGRLSLDAINPWFYREPLAPAIAAQRNRRKVRLSEVTKTVRETQRLFPIVIVEGAGGLLSPLGDGFDARDLIGALAAVPLVVCPNRLGAINQTRLVLAALPKKASESARVILMSQKEPDHSCRSNIRFLRDSLGRKRVHILPWGAWKGERRHSGFRGSVAELVEDLGF